MLQKNLNRIKNLIATYLVIVQAVLVPLYMDNGYFNLIEAKARVFLLAVWPALTAAAVILLIQAVNRIKTRTTEPVEHFLPSETALLLFAAWSVLSSALSGYFRASFLGAAGWAVGSLMILSLALSAILIGRWLTNGQMLLTPVLVVNGFIFTLAVLQSAGIDPYHLTSRLRVLDRYAYLSTIGQKNSFSGYLCLVMPFFAGMFVLCTDKAAELCTGAVCFCGCLCMVLCESDSLYAGLAVCLVCMLPFLLAERRRTLKTAFLLSLYGCALLAVRLLPALSGKVGSMQGLARKMLAPPCIGSVFLAAAGLCFYELILLRLENPKRRRVLVCFWEALLLTGILAGTVWSVLHFSDTWGTNRGMIWRAAWEFFRDESLYRKLVGIGPEMLAMVYQSLQTPLPVLTAHSEPLQILLAQGCVGFGLYTAFWILMLCDFVKGKRWKQKDALAFYSLACYFGQSLFCSVYPVTAVLFGLMTGIYFRMRRQKG